jgi:SAM-dependent methyltransferase
MHPIAVRERLLEQSLVYRLWMGPQVRRKFAPIQAHNDLSQVRRVLDVGCGPGTNTSQFESASSYLGLDINPAYIESAKRRYSRDFLAVDVTRYEVPESERFDFVLINSFLHHLDTPDVRRILAHVGRLLAPEGHVHMLELVLPNHRSVARTLAKWDRGDFARPLEQWRELFSDGYQPIVFEPYTVGMPNVVLWNMIYCKAKATSLAGMISG